MKKPVVLGVCGFLINASAQAGLPATRTIELGTKQVTQPDVAVMPDGVEKSIPPAAGLR